MPSEIAINPSLELRARLDFSLKSSDIYHFLRGGLKIKSNYCLGIKRRANYQGDFGARCVVVFIGVDLGIIFPQASYSIS
jgi:hypothetical protein